MTTLKHIVHVDDEPDIREIVKMTLESIGDHAVESFDSGQALLDNISSLSPDLIIIDVMMPGMDGPTTFRELQARPATTDLPVIFMTAKVQAHEIKQYMDIGGIGVITKPFDPMELSKEVEQIWKDYNEQ